MACNDGLIARWFMVLDGSTLEVSVGPKDGQPAAFAVTATRTTGTTPLTDWTDPQLRAGASMQLASPNVYTAVVVITFAAATTVVVRACVRRPDGELQRTEHCQEFTGTNETRTLAIIAATQLS